MGSGDDKNNPFPEPLLPCIWPLESQTRLPALILLEALYPLSACVRGLLEKARLRNVQRLCPKCLQFR